MGSVKLLLDAYTFHWLVQQPERISSPAADFMDAPENDLILSDVSLLEIVMKHSAGKLPLPDLPRKWLSAKLGYH